MSLQHILTALALPPLLFVLLGLCGVVLAWRGRRLGIWLAAVAAGSQLLLATPLVAGLLLASLEREVVPLAIPPGAAPGAIVVLSAEVVHLRDGLEIGPLTLERLRAGAALHRRTGLPLLVTGGSLAPGDEAVALLMAHSLEADFGVSARWIEARALDTRENAVFSAAMLREAGIGSAFLVTHAWHMPRALEAFERTGFVAAAAPVRIDRLPDGRPSEWLPRPDYWGRSWFALREWAGRLIYALRDSAR